jgi:HAD superfamily hydrolase (TIGR01549 family)
LTQIDANYYFRCNEIGEIVLILTAMIAPWSQLKPYARSGVPLRGTLLTTAIIFDIDGTILDSVDLHAKAWQEAFEHFGYSFSFESIRAQIGKGGDQLLPVFLSEEDQKSKGDALKEFRSELFKKKYLSQVKPFPGVRDLFLKIKANGQQRALASSAKGDELETFAKIAQVDDLVDVSTSSADAEKSKPHPDIFEAALAKLGNGIDRSSVLVVGDSPHDAEAAKKAGLRMVGVLCGGFAEEDLRAAGAESIYSGPEELFRRYEETPLAPGTANNR